MSSKEILRPFAPHVNPADPDRPCEESRGDREILRKAEGKPHRSARQLAALKCRPESSVVVATIAEFERSPGFRVAVQVRRRVGVENYISTVGLMLTPSGTWIPNGRPVNWRGAEIPQLLGALRDALKVLEAGS